MTSFYRALPCFVYHRQNWDIVFPFLQLKKEELNELKSKRTYVAGFTDPAVENRTETYDLFLNGKLEIKFNFRLNGYFLYFFNLLTISVRIRVNKNLGS